jgi:hypothetical protein
MIYKEKYTGDAVIKRGYEIYDEWDRGGFSSRRIVRFTERALALVQAKNTPASCIEALSCLFALDMRIQEKYNTLLRCLFSYFSWRRETRTFKLLKAALHFPLSGEADIRTAIEVALQQLREKLENEELDDGDDETRGGKRNGKGDEDSAVTEEKNQENVPEENAEELANAEESEELSEEKTEELSEQTPTEEPIKEGSEEAQTAEPLQEENVTQEQKEEVKQEEAKQEESSELKEENNGPEEASEPSHYGRPDGAAG